MKRTLYLKLLGGYLLFGLLGFLIIATFTYHLTFQHLEKKEAQNLYRESALISSSYAQNYFSNSMTLDEINEQLSALDTYLNADIWIVDTHGKILINTAGTENTDETIPDFDMTDFGNRYYRVGTFYDYFQENMLSVFSPITVNCDHPQIRIVSDRICKQSVRDCIHNTGSDLCRSVCRTCIIYICSLYSDPQDHACGR